MLRDIRLPEMQNVGFALFSKRYNNVFIIMHRDKNIRPMNELYKLYHRAEIMTCKNQRAEAL